MTDLFLNDCLPSNFSDRIIIDGLHSIELLLSKQGISISKGISLTKSAEMVLFNGKSLKNHILSLPKDEQSFYFGLFYMKQTVEELINNYESEDAIKYLYDCNFNNRNANDLAAAGIMGLFAISFPAEDELKSDNLNVEVVHPETHESESSVSVKNYYGENIEYALNQLVPQHASTTDELVRLFNVRGKSCYMTVEFNKAWDNITNNYQERIIKRFEDAINAALVFPRKADDNIIKRDISGTTVHELRDLSNGQRVYFKSGCNTIIIGLYGTKTRHYGADQSSDFMHANQIINEYMLKNGITL